MRRAGTTLALAAVTSLSIAASASAVSLEPIGTYSSPVFVTSDPTNEDRIFVVEQDGRIRLTSNGATTEFLNIDSLVISAGEPGGGGEQGLFSMAFAPDFAASGRFYVFYTEISAGNLRVAELTAGGDSADPATLREVITVPHTGGAQNHNGGQLQFGPDGYLYVSTGDGGTGGGPAQDPGNLLGKILRIAPTAGGGYSVPADNPLGNEVWSLGLRNPWRFSFDRATGDLLIADVGAGTWEEVDISPATQGAGRGLNFGWPCREGPGPGTGCTGSFVEPTFWYATHDGGTCAVTGGYVVRDPGLEELYGRYVYADFCAGVVRSFDPASPFATDRSEGLSAASLASFGEDVCGRVYVASRAGHVSRLVDGTPTECPDPVSDLSGPGLALDAKKRQSIERRRRVRVEAVADEAGVVTLGGEVTVGTRENELFTLAERTVSVTAGAAHRLDLKLKRKPARHCRRLIEDGKRVEVQISGAASDASGNRGPDAKLEVRLVLD
jgi:glucose/sorbosone dehydrogenase